MPFTQAADNQALDALNGGTPSSIIGFASLHSAYSAAGANELTGGSPAYTRVALTWAPSATGSKSLTTPLPAAFNVPPANTVAFIGLWSLVTGGTFAGMGANGGAPQYAFTAAVTGNLFTAPVSSYTNGQAVVLFAGVGTTTPSGFTAGTIYYVVSASGATFQLSATSGGSAVAVGAAGSGLVQAITLESFGSQGTFTLTADSLSVV